MRTPRRKARSISSSRNLPTPRGNEAMAEIIVGLDLRGRLARDGGMAGQIHIIGDDGRGGIGAAGTLRQHRHRIGNAEREAPPAPAAGRDAADRIRVPDLGVAEKRRLIGPVDQADAEAMRLRAR